MVSIPGLNAQEKAHFEFPLPAVPAPIRIHSLGLNPSQETVFRPRGLEHFQWLQTLEGRGQVTVGARTFSLSPLQGLLLAPGVPHSYHPLDRHWTTAYIVLSGPLLEPLLAQLGLKFSARYRWTQGPFSHLVVEQVLAYRQGRWGDEWQRSEAAYHFLMGWKDHCRLDEAYNEATGQERLMPLFRYIEERLADPAFGVDDMADFLHVSPRHLTELFRRVCQTSPYHHLRQLRLQRARDLLLWEPNTGIKEIAARVGFRDPSHFILTFRQAMGASPDLYRRRIVMRDLRISS